jgi:asparagine synthase (glutamine-hydrolysing)
MSSSPWRRVRGNLQAFRIASVNGNLRTLLRHEDRNSMASSIESRVPFLTPALAAFAAGMPDDYLIAPDGTGKLVLRRSLRGLVPAPILDRRDKIGFATPEASWLRTLEPWIEDVFASDAARHAGPLRVAEARRCWQEMRDGTRQFNPMAWRWLNLIRWLDRFAVELE